MQISRILSGVAAIASFGPLAAIYRAYRRDIRKAQARISTSSSVINTERGPIEYASIGEGVPLIIVHGAGGGFDQALDLAAHLVSRVQMYFRFPLRLPSNTAARRCVG